MSTKQTRIFLWAIPRSTSSAFLRAMVNRQNIEVILEPYARPYYFGPDRVSSRYASEPIQEEDTFSNIRCLCEQPYPGADEVFIKDMAYYVLNQPPTDTQYIEVLPTGYIHTFLIRNPAKTVPSLYRLSIDKELTGWDHFDPCEVGFKELYQMFELVTKKLGQEAIIVDADDLVTDPAYILKQYCTRVGIEFQQSMVDWEDDPQNHPVFKDWSPGWFGHVFNSKRFESSTLKPVCSLVMPTFPESVQEAILDSMAYYDKMYMLRIKLNMVST